MMLDYSIYAALAAVVIIFFSSAIRIQREYERGVVFTFGRFTGVKGPGLIILIPVVQQMVRVDLRVVVQEVPPQDVISRGSPRVGVISSRKGVNLPGTILDVSPLTAKDCADFEFGLRFGVDWVTLSFVQKAPDVLEASGLIGDRGGLVARIEKPAAQAVR
ncbi:pyruvate kinase [Nitrobacter sp. JJSN]|uniref:SPFH domain-containing protein n=1 Tax=Nitrobacter sp. JJSN TaxID=3453033 RepID=UPI003F76A8B4